MTEVITTAGAASTDAAGAEPQAAQTIPSDRERIAAAVAKLSGQPAEPAPTADAKPEPEAEKQPSLAELVRQQRAEREAARQAKQKSSTLEQELSTTRSELAKLKSNLGDFEMDPVGYAKARGWSKEQQLLMGQALLYDLAPDKADPEFRMQMMEMRQKTREAAEQKAAEEREAKQAAEQQRRLAEDFFNETVSAVRGFETGSYPESESWFDGDMQSYMQSLMATANNLATKATKEGRVADLSPAALASALEAEVASRMARRDERKQKRTAPVAPQTPAQPAGGKQTTIDTLSTRNMNGSGSPLPPATSEKERIQRAIMAGFPNR